MPGNGPLNH